MKNQTKKKDKITGEFLDKIKEEFKEQNPYIAEMEELSKKWWQKRLEEKGEVPEENTLMILKRWGSKAPTLMKVKGGGYLLFINKMGIVIDPGYYFKDNLLELGYTIANINIIIITHNHPDHTDDLVKLINGIRERKQHVDLYTTPLTYEMFNKVIDTNEDYVHFNELNGSSIKIHDSPYQIIFPDAYHKEIPEERDDEHRAKGVTIVNKKTKEVVISISGDTKFKNQLLRSHKDVRLLISHIGSPSGSENHLGYIGTEKLIKGVNPEFVIVSEFDMEEFGAPGTRLATINKLQNTTRKIILVGDIGLSVQFEGTFQIKAVCQICAKQHWVNIEQVKQIEVNDEIGNRIEYLTEKCPNDVDFV
ncbi:MAG: MBL fold metallo-hydrolase [Candidatus Hermodarchaeota archaeon]